MTWRVRDDKRDSGRESKEWKRRRFEKAFDEARRLRIAEWELQRRAGKEPKNKPSGIGELANYLLKVESDKIDKLVDDDFRKAQERGVTKVRSAKKRFGADGAKKLESLAAGFKAYMEKRKDARKLEDSASPDTKMSIQCTPKASFKRVMTDAKQIRKRRDSPETKFDHANSKRFKVDVKQDGSIQDIDALAEKLYNEATRRKKRTSFLELNINGLDGEKAKRFKQSVEETKTILETNLRERFGPKHEREEIRVGFVDNRMYVWRINNSQNDMLNAWSNQYFYFKEKGALKHLQDNALRSLKLNPQSPESKNHVNKLMDQILRKTDNETLKKSRHLKENRIQGESLKFLMDSLGMETQFLEKKVAKITGIKGQGGLENPEFPTGEELQILRARIVGTAVSDCQVRGSKGLVYSESSGERIDRFQDTLRNFGDIQLKRNFREDRGTYEIYINSAMSEAVTFWGIPEGDRTILNHGLPSDVHKWSNNAQRALIQDMFSQEGCVSENGEISWNRRHALCAGNKSKKYDFQSKLSPDAVRFLKGSKEAKRDYETGTAGEIYLTIGKLEILRNDQDKFKVNAAREILHTVNDYRNQLIDDEAAVVRGFGINATLDPMQVSYYKKSGRVSVRWQARIRDNESKMRSAFLLRPNDRVKESILDDWLMKQPSGDVKRVKDTLGIEGFDV